MNSDIHPNFFLIDNKNFDKEIKIEQIRQLLIFLNKSTYSRNLKIILIDNIENLNLSSANALLKPLEEPNNNTFFIIIHNNSFKLLETIKSRTTEFKITFSKNEKEEIFHKIIKQNNMNITKVLNESLHFDTPGNIIKYLLALNTKNQDLNNSNIDNALFFIEKYINDKSSETLSFLKIFIEKFYYYLFLNNKDKINNYFYNYMKILKQIDNMKRFNLDEKNTFILVKNLLINEKR
jgi:DNA polymerase III delta prime subunit